MLNHLTGEILFKCVLISMQHVLKNVWIIWIRLKAGLSSTRTFTIQKTQSAHIQAPEHNSDYTVHILRLTRFLCLDHS